MMAEVKQLLGDQNVTSTLSSLNKTIIRDAEGKIGPKLLLFIGQGSRCKVHQQFARVMARLTKDTGPVAHSKLLIKAIKHNLVLEAKILIANLPSHELSQRHGDPGYNALSWAIYKQSLSLVQRLIARGVDCNATDVAIPYDGENTTISTLLNEYYRDSMAVTLENNRLASSV